MAFTKEQVKEFQIGSDSRLYVLRNRNQNNKTGRVDEYVCNYCDMPNPELYGGYHRSANDKRVRFHRDCWDLVKPEV